MLMVLGVCITVAFGRPQEDQATTEDDSEEEEDKRPYSFSYAASRYYHGIPDREHQEARGEDGITRGVFRYVDPRLQVQEVVYYADDDGFHVDASNLPRETEAVLSARSKHASEFERIRQEHAKIAAEQATLEEAAAQPKFVDPEQQKLELIKKLPKDTRAVENRRNHHFYLFEKIREEHARIGAEIRAEQERRRAEQEEQERLRAEQEALETERSNEVEFF